MKLMCWLALSMVFGVPFVELRSVNGLCKCQYLPVLNNAVIEIPKTYKPFVL